MKCKVDDGDFTYSPVVALDRKSNQSVSISPNPAKDFVLVTSQDVSLLNSIVRFTDAGGRLVQLGGGYQPPSFV